MSVKNILYIEQPLCNRGDESAHRGIIRALNTNYPEANIYIVFIDANDADIEAFKVYNPKNSYINIPTLKGYRFCLLRGLNNSIWWKIHPTLRKFTSYLKMADAVICAPGGINLGGFMGWEHLAYVSMAKKWAKNVVYYGRSVGPFYYETPTQIEFSQKSTLLLKSVDFLSVRDLRSAAFLEELAISHHLTVDSAFLDCKQFDIPQFISHQIGNSKFAVVVPNVLIWHFAYSKTPKGQILYYFKELISRILIEYPEVNIVLTPQTFNEPTYLRNDINFFNELSSEINNNRIIVLNDNISSDIQQAIFRKASFVVGARYHSMIFAINQESPLVALCYEHKMNGLLEYVDLPHLGVKIDSSTFENCETISASIEDTLKKLRYAISHKDEIVSASAKAKNIAMGCFNKLLQFLHN